MYSLVTDKKSSSNKISKQQQQQAKKPLAARDKNAPSGEKSKRSVTSELFNKLITYPDDDDK